MKDEIKEILYYFKKYHFEDTMIDGKECKLLYDYITNLQEENKKVHKELDYADNYNIYLISKIDKTIEYNQQIIKDTKDFYRPTEDIIYSGDTLIDIAMNNINILQGGDK